MSAAAAVVTPVFTAVRGRARLRVAGLRGRPLFAARLEDHVSGRHAVRHVRTNPVTGTILILFDAGRIDVRRLMREVALDVEHTRRPPPAPGTATARGRRAWHTVSDTAALAHLDTSRSGLTSADATRRLSTLGGNRMPVPRPKSALAIIRGHLLSAPVLILVGAGALSAATGALVEAAVIIFVVVANTAVGYATESRVERILHSLQSGGVPTAIARRDGRDIVVPATALVPGDLIVVRAGADVPADARLLEADHLVVDESALTGESLPVTKSAHVLRRLVTPVAEQVNMVFAGTGVAEGSGLAVVTATGRDTEFGRVRTLVAHTRPPATPLEQQLERAGRRLVALSLGFCAAILALGLLRGLPALATTRMVISLGVAAVPEGLPAVATTTLALGMQRMMRRRTLVRRLAAVEGLGATTVICADKTGTLTQNRMTVAAWYLGRQEHRAAADKPGPALAGAMTLSVLCNEAELNGNDSVTGSATEGALLTAALEAGIDYRDVRARHHLVSVRPRAEGHNWMATIHSDGTRRHLLTVKGAPEEVLARATAWLDEDVERPLTPDVRSAVLRANARLARSGMRVLGLACRHIEPHAGDIYGALVWVGLVAFTDPVRPGVREALAACRAAGIRTVILTGDQAPTAAAVCRELQLVPNGRVRVVEAAQLAPLDGDALRALVREVDVFARVSPVHKYQIVRALQASGEVVTMTGDGINDAAALKAADIGVAMGARGTDVARDVADVVLADDDFGALVRAIEQGRTIHRNIGKTLRFLLATNFSEILLTLGTLALGVPSPMSAIQFLWINLLSDLLPALALALDAPEADVMQRPPRDPATPLLDRADLATIAADAGVLAGASLVVHTIARGRYGAGPHATTLAFSTLTTAQLLHALTSRRPPGAPATAPRSPVLLGVVGGSIALQLLAVTAPPLRRLLGTTALSVADWGLVAAGVAVPMLTRRALSGAPLPLTL